MCKVVETLALAIYFDNMEMVDLTDVSVLSFVVDEKLCNHHVNRKQTEKMNDGVDWDIYELMEIDVM